MGKNTEKKKRKSGVYLETAPACVLTYENLQKDQLQITTDSENPITDISMSLESSSETPKKKKHKRKRLSEQQAENNCTTEQHSEGHLDDKKKLKNEDVSYAEDTNNEDAELSTSTEEPQRKKKKRERTKEGNKAQESETPSNETSEEAPTMKKKKKKEKALKENIAEQEGSLTVTSERQSNDDLKKKKKNKSVVKKRKKAKSASTREKTRTSQDKEVDTGIRTEAFTEIDAKCLKELKEFIPDIESKEPVSINKMIKYDLPRFQEFRKQGISLSHGRFTAQENEKLRQNVRDFMTLTAIDSATKLFFTHRFEQEQENIKKLKGLHKFFERIAEGIPRSCYYVYARGRRMFDEQNYQGEFTKAELHTLNKLHTLHGNNWKKISELTGRSAFSLQKRYTQLANKEGPWSKKEVQRLLRAVRDYIVSQIPGTANSNRNIRVMKETLYKRLPLQKIAKRVKTRSWSQCREKWMAILAVKMSFGAVATEKKSLDVQVKLIKRMYEMDVDDAAHVNWEDLTAVIGDVPPAYVQRKWHKLKVCHVPDWQRKCFADIVDYLYEKVLPDLEKKLLAHKDLEETQHTENDDESYLLSDIFQDINEDEDVDDDDLEEAEKDVDNDDKKGIKEKESQ
ncbi:transcription termination factor 1-like [Tachysurus vachellii]|uniref:transcription termination factor 1-like n=1 Tax=Tachysurus vachellii TaxID=175792 RepID=UPI00296B2F60|nr:transcription termination factor 1-like [Tachysurus vachellii]